MVHVRVERFGFTAQVSKNSHERTVFRTMIAGRKIAIRERLSHLRRHRVSATCLQEDVPRVGQLVDEKNVLRIGKGRDRRFT